MIEDHSRDFVLYRLEEHFKRNSESVGAMENSTKMTSNHLSRELTTLIIFEIFIGIISVLIIVTSSLVIKHISRKTHKSRADLMFIILSIADIGVATLSMPALGIYGPFWDTLIENYFNASKVLLIGAAFFYDFPYIFSYIVTTIIAIDRLFIITRQKRYENFITKKRLKSIVLFSFLIAIAYCCISTYYILPDNSRKIGRIIRIGYLLINIISIITIISAYVYILCFVHRRTSTMSSYKHCEKNDNKQISKTILYIFICQIVFILPYLLLFLMAMLRIPLPYMGIGPWLVALRNCQCFCNSLVLLHKEKKKRRKRSECVSLTETL